MSLIDALVSPADPMVFSHSDLNIKYLQDFWGSLLDMTTTVGQTFIDRACGVDVSNSIVKVVRFPPTPIELEDPLRCASLAPESSARPRKRGFEEFTECVQTELRDAPYTNTFDPEQLIVSQRVSKRQRKRNLGSNDAGNYIIPIQSSEAFENAVSQDPLQTSIIQRSSSIQVNDSQRSPAIKRVTSLQSLARNLLIHIGRNPYGTPLSFSLHSPQGLASFNQRGNLAIPESPSSRETPLTENPSLLTTEHELGNAKSASPELDSSVHGKAKANNPSKSFEKQGIDDESFGIQNRSALAVSGPASLSSDPVHAKGADSNLEENLRAQAMISETSGSSSRPKFRLPGRVESSDLSATSSKVRDLFDPIETEGEKPQEPQNFRRVKRLKSNVSLPSKSAEGHQSPHEDIRQGLPAFPHTLQGQKTLPVDLELLDLDGQNRPSSSANTFKQASSPTKAAQDIINGSPERPSGQFRPQNFPLELQNEAGAASECASIINEQIKSTITNPLKRGIQRTHPVEQAPLPTHAGLSQPPNLADMTGEVSLRDHTGERKQNTRSKNFEASIDSSLGHNAKDKQPDDPVAVAVIEDPKSPEDSFSEKRPKSANLEDEKYTSKPTGEKSDEPKLADSVRRENERRKKILQEIQREVGQSKPLQGKEKPLKATDTKARKSKVRGENHKDMKSSGKRPVDNAGKPETVRAVEPNKARREETAKQAETRHAVEGRSGSLTTNGLSKKLEPLESVTPKRGTRSDAQTHSPVTSNSRNDTGRARKSMTPAFPGPALIKQTSVESRPSIRARSQPPIHPEVLLRDDTACTSRTVSRPIAVSKDHPSTLSSSQDIAPEFSTEKDRKSKTDGIVNARFRDISEIKKEPNSKLLADISKHSTEKTPKQVKTQMKLNVIRDVKGKGRLDDPPSRLQTKQQETIIVSSEDEKSASSFYSDENSHTKRVKAGPSSKRKGLSREEFSNEKASTKEISATGLGSTRSKLVHTTEDRASLAKDQTINTRNKTSQGSKVKVKPKLSTATSPKNEEPRLKKPREKAVHERARSDLQAIKQENLIEEPALPPSSNVDPTVGTTIISPRNSSPRAPAQYMAKHVSISSGSESNADSETDPESGSESDSRSDSEVESEINASARKSPWNHLKSDERNGTASQRNPARDPHVGVTAQKKRASSVFTPFKANSSRLAKSSASKISNKSSGREADEQLQRECRQSVGPNIAKVSSTSSHPTSDEETKLSHPPNTNGDFVESKRRPSNYPYPSMTELKEKRSEKVRSQHVANNSVSKSTSPNVDPKLLGQGNSSDSSSNSEDDSDNEQDARLDSTKSEQKPSKTVQRLMKSKFKT